MPFAQKTIPDEVVAMIRLIINVDRRERRAAGYSQRSRGLATRIAQHYGLKLNTVRSIIYRKRRHGVFAARLMQDTYTVPAERLERIRQRRLREQRK